MSIPPEVEEYISRVETYSGRRFQQREVIAFLIQSSTRSKSAKEEFDRLTFLAKFVSHSHSILKRTPAGSPETEKLAPEFRDALERTAVQIRTLAEEASETIRKELEQRFLSLSHEGIQNLLSLLTDLSWIKNYELDHPSGINR